MFELKITVSKVLGTCTSDEPMTRGDHFFVRDGDLHIPEGGHICLYALQNLLPLIPAKERALAESHDEDWMWRVRHVQCPDPKGRVVFTIDQVRTLGKDDRQEPVAKTSAVPDSGSGFPAEAALDSGSDCPVTPCDLRVVVEQVKGTCTSGMRPGDYFLLRGGRIFIPSERHFCLYALQAALPLLPAKQRRPAAGDWMAEEHHVICPDPAGNVILRIERA
jgi:uncharacterized repeat protein (TIGR04076 family)